MLGLGAVATVRVLQHPAGETVWAWRGQGGQVQNVGAREGRKKGVAVQGWKELGKGLVCQGGGISLQQHGSEGCPH